MKIHLDANLKSVHKRLAALPPAETQALVTQWLECHRDKVEVVGSNPTESTKR